MDLSARNGHLSVVMWLHEHWGECTVMAMNHAAEQGHLQIVEWLHANRTEGCTLDAFKWAADRSHWEVLIWLIRNRKEIKCSVNTLHAAIKQRQLSVVELLYERKEMESWPRPFHVSILLDLFSSNNSGDEAILMHFLNVRKLRYHPNLAINSVYEDIGGRQDAPSASVEPFVLTSASKVCLPHSFLDLPKIISDFIIGDPNCVRNHKTAVDRGWVTWLFRFSKNPSKDVKMLTNLRDFIGARLLHDLLRSDGRLYCSKHCCTRR